MANYIFPTKNLTKKYYFTMNTVIIEVSNIQDKDKCGKMYGFDNGVQRPDSELIGMFPHLKFTGKRKKYDEDGNLTNVDETYDYYMWLDKYVSEGDLAVGSDVNKPCLTCTPDLHDDDCNKFYERFVKDWETAAVLAMQSGTLITSLRASFPKYFTALPYEEPVTQSVKITHYRRKESTPSSYPETITQTTYNSYSALSKSCYTQRAMYKRKSTASSTLPTPITEEQYNALDEETKQFYELYYVYDRKSTITKSSYDYEITFAQHGTLTDDEKNLYRVYEYYATKTQTATIEHVSAVDPAGGSAADGAIQVLNNTHVENALMPIAREAAIKAANEVLQGENKAVKDDESVLFQIELK